MEMELLVALGSATTRACDDLQRTESTKCLDAYVAAFERGLGGEVFAYVSFRAWTNKSTRGFSYKQSIAGLPLQPPTRRNNKHQAPP